MIKNKEIPENKENDFYGVEYTGKTEDGQEIYTAYFPQIIEEKGVLAVATDASQDRDGDVVDPKGLDLKNYKKNPILLFGHDHRGLPVGQADKIKKEGNRITFEPAITTVTEFARDVKALFDAGILRAFSIGFIPKERDKNVFTKAELLEISIVNVPSNPNALVMAKSKGLNMDLLDTTSKGSPNLGQFPVGRNWDADTAKSRMQKLAGGPDKEDISFSKYGQGFAFIDETNEDNFAGYKLPFADVDEDSLKAVWRGVATAMAALLGARGGVDIPTADRRKVYNFLVGYYKKFEKEPPEFRNFEDINQVIESWKKRQIRAVDAMDMIIALHQDEPERKPSVKEKVELPTKDDKMKEVLHLFVQQMSKQTNYILKKVNEHGKGS